MNWRKIQNGKKPKNREEVLACRMNGEEMEDLSLCVYMKAGTTYNDEKDECEVIQQAGEYPEIALLQSIFDEGKNVVQSDGFFYIESDENGLCKYREMRGVTHWMRIYKPSKNR